MIDSQVGDEMGLDEVARRCGIPARTLNGFFKNAVGLEFHDYKVRQRLERGRKALISRQSASIAEACELVGCSAISEFRQLFEDYLGESPEAYQLRMRENGRLLEGSGDGYPLSLVGSVRDD